MMKVKVKTHIRRLPGRQVPTPPWGADLRGGGRGVAKLAAPTAGWRPAAYQRLLNGAGLARSKAVKAPKVGGLVLPRAAQTKLM